jgi:hypothetical protein
MSDSKNNNVNTPYTTNNNATSPSKSPVGRTNSEGESIKRSSSFNYVQPRSPRSLSSSASSSSSPPASPRTVQQSPHSNPSPLANHSPPSPVFPRQQVLSSSAQNANHSPPSPVLASRPPPGLSRSASSALPLSSSTTSLIPPPTPKIELLNDEQIDNELNAPIWSFNFLGSEIRLDPSFSAYAVYKIEVTLDAQEWKIFRRYNQFYELDMKLRELFPKEKIPRVPPKHFLRSATSPELVEERKELLQKYVDELVSNTRISASSAFYQWFSPSNDPPFASLDNPDKTGFLMKEGHVFRNWKKRFFILKDGALYYFKRPGDAEPLGMIPVIGSLLKTFPDHKLRFEISHPGDMLPSFTLQASNEAELREWTEAIAQTQALFVNLLNSNSHNMPASPTAASTPVTPPTSPGSPMAFSVYAARSPILSPRIKSAPNSPFMPMRSNSQPVLPQSILPRPTASPAKKIAQQSSATNLTPSSPRISTQRGFLNGLAPLNLNDEDASKNPTSLKDSVKDRENRNTTHIPITRRQRHVDIIGTPMSKSEAARARRARANTMIPINESGHWVQADPNRDSDSGGSADESGPGTSRVKRRSYSSDGKALPEYDLLSKLTATKGRVDQQLEIFYFHLEKHQFKLQMMSSTTHAQEIKVLDKMMDIVNTILDTTVPKLQSKQTCSWKTSLEMAGSPRPCGPTGEPPPLFL